ncbi:TauD/TfdA family dioxygenase [Candidatus Albibeggiatoa sp. nov. NOAA]|uniref:TauD/TfdA family dioxygenase n=1 Tax=Candidatus Albibeggiatoa sp. nov. NOAA TaxID=3162724 RepID=UPI0032F63865|nr:TauD/TfdA family dioxygenase [Thiotrichaceae bacterium]
MKNLQTSFITNYQTRQASPFDLSNDASYLAWRDSKLENYPSVIKDLIIPIKNPKKLSFSEKSQILGLLYKTNIAFYQVQNDIEVDKNSLDLLGRQFGLAHIDRTLTAEGEDGITPLQVEANGERHDYIPYTDKPINWHTDGYYNEVDKPVQAMLLHCTRPALEGGENQIVDNDLAYIYLRDKNPAYIEALMQNDVMTIPANEQNGQILRAESVGSVFSINEQGGLRTRYTARKRNIIWKDDPIVKEAVTELNAFLNSESPYIFRHCLAPNQGLICNNVLHNRTGFKNGNDIAQQRLIYRIRYYDAVQEI